MSLSLLQLGADQILKNVLCTPNNSRSEETIDIDAEREHDVLLVWLGCRLHQDMSFKQPNIDAVKVKKILNITYRTIVVDWWTIKSLNVEYK